MRLLSYDPGGGARIGLANERGVVDLTRRTGITSMRALIAADKVGSMAMYAHDAGDHDPDKITYLPVVRDPAHIYCVGVNYADHLQEAKDMGLPRDHVAHPMIFMRYADTLVGHNQPILKSPHTDKLDYECELAAIIGKGGRHISVEDALDHVVGYSCFNEASARDWQYHTSQIGPGKNFYHTGGFGPWMVTADEIPDPQTMTIKTILNGEVMQDAHTKNMIFDTKTIIAYVSNMLPLQPGDVIATGTPSGVGQSRDPQVFMKPGDTCVVEIERVGTLINPIGEG